MFSTVYLAEKRSIARALADVLPGRHVARDGYIECGDVAVTWLSGHLLQLLEPEGYDPRYRTWSRATLPVIPGEFRSEPRPDRNVLHQMEVIRRLLGEAPTAVNAADFDREGQLLVDELLELVDYPGKVLRIQTKALDRTSLGRELGRLRPNEEFAGLRDAARARSQLDWLAGMNLTRAMTLVGRRAGATGVLSLGRVQTPTLALVVARDEEIEHFVPRPFYRLECPFRAEGGSFATQLLTSAGMEGCDEEKRLVDRAVAERIAADCSGAPGTVTGVESRDVSEPAPLPYSLTDIQKEASAKYGMGASTVLDACQSLYEARVASYPRTDCQYLPMEQFAEAGEVLAAVAAFPGMADMVQAADVTRKSAAWNTARVKAHHAIIPTGVKAGALSERDAKIYFLICRRYVWQFLPPHLYRRTRADVACAGWTWRAMGRVETSPGWTAFREKDPREKEVVLPPLAKGQAVTAGKVKIAESKTTPPARFTEGTLVDAMANIQRYLKDATKDEKSILVRTEGLGTVATRAAIIQRLFDRGYVKRRGRALVSTPLGRSLVKLCPPSIRDPLMTAEMERQLSRIQEGQLDYREYVAGYAAKVPGLVDAIFAVDPAGSGIAPAAEHVCPRCGAALRRVRSHAGRWFWSCSGYPDCTFAAADEKGRPGRAFSGSGGQKKEKVVSDVDCPRCGKHKLMLRVGPTGPFWGCGGYPSCRYTCPDEDGHPCPQLRPQAPATPAQAAATGRGRTARTGRAGRTGQPEAVPSPASEAPAAEIFACPECGGRLAPVAIRRGPHAGETAWICRNEAGHAGGRARFFDDVGGRPRLPSSPAQAPSPAGSAPSRGKTRLPASSPAPAAASSPARAARPSRARPSPAVPPVPAAESQPKHPSGDLPPWEPGPVWEDGDLGLPDAQGDGGLPTWEDDVAPDSPADPGEKGGRGGRRGRA